MAFSITLPLLDTCVTTKDHIISILGDEWPLSAKMLHTKIKTRFGKSVTYQAVYKSVKELESSGAIKHEGVGYEINISWIKSLQRFTEIIESNYFSKKKIASIAGLKDSRKEGNINVITFETYFDAEKYLHYFIKHYASVNSVVCFHHVHEWMPLLYLRAEYNKAVNARKQNMKIYRVCNGTTDIDKWAIRFYKSLGQKAKNGVQCADMCELIIVDDIVIQMYLPSDIRDALSHALKVGFSEIQMKTIIEKIFGKKTSIEVVISKNAEIAKQMMKKTVSYF